jgi:hypothetical protein
MASPLLWRAASHLVAFTSAFGALTVACVAALCVLFVTPAGVLGAAYLIALLALIVRPVR